LNQPKPASLSGAVLQEHQGATGTDDPCELACGCGRVRHRAQCQTQDTAVGAAGRKRQVLAAAWANGDRDWGVSGCVEGQVAQVGFWLDGVHLGHRGGIVSEVHAITATHLDDPAN
jgi:hypothetical protein